MSIFVSNHALLRYVERVLHIDVEAIRAELSGPVFETAAEIGCDTVILSSGARAKLVGDVVQTVLAKDMRDHHYRVHGVLLVERVDG